jgi:hypothetical protein
VKPVGEPDAGDRHVRFDERGWETARCRMAQATAPILDSTECDLRAAPINVRSWESNGLIINADVAFGPFMTPTRTFSPSPQFHFPTHRTGFDLISTGGHAPSPELPLWRLGPRIDLRPLIHDYCRISFKVAVHDYTTRASGRSPGLFPRL